MRTVLVKKFCAWTLNYQGDMQRMFNCGVDNIITDDPELVRKVILGTTDRNPRLCQPAWLCTEIDGVKQWRWKLHGRESKHAIPEERKEEKKRGRKKLPSDFYDYNLLACTILLVSFD